MQTHVPNRLLRRSRWRDLLHECIASEPTEQGERLAEAVKVLGRVALRPSARFRAMIACGAYESAALLVIGQDRPFLLSRGASGHCIASTVCGCATEATAEAVTPALAMLAAHLSALLTDDGLSDQTTALGHPSAPARLH